MEQDKSEIKDLGIEKIWRKINQENVLIGIIIVLIAVLVVQTFFPNVIGSLGLRAGEKKYNIEAIKIETQGNYFDLSLISALLDKIENINVKEKTLDYSSKEAGELIEEYNIQKLPALILLSKNIDKISLDENIFRKEKNAAIFDKAVPYLDLGTGEAKGFVDLIEIYDPSCSDCTSLSKLKTQLETTRIKIKNYTLLDSKSDNGKELIKENNITFLPALLASKNIKEYWWIFESIKSILKENENYYKFSEPLFPYKEISSGLVKGKVRITYLENKSCEECFNVTELKSAFQNLGVYISNERYVDVSSDEGENLLAIYNITAIPTVILSGEISDYTKLKSVLEQVGSFENKEFVFRKLDVLNVKYQKLEGGG